MFVYLDTAVNPETLELSSMSNNMEVSFYNLARSHLMGDRPIILPSRMYIDIRTFNVLKLLSCCEQFVL